MLEAVGEVFPEAKYQRCRVCPKFCVNTVRERIERSDNRAAQGESVC